MAEIIEKQELPVTITKVKIGTKDLTKSLVIQLPIGNYVYHIKDGKRLYGLAAFIDHRDNQIEINNDIPAEYEGILLGFLNIELPKQECDKMKYLMRHKDSYEYLYEKYLILWTDSNNNLKKGYIDQWTIDQLGIKLEQIFI